VILLSAEEVGWEDTKELSNLELDGTRIGTLSAFAACVCYVVHVARQGKQTCAAGV